MKSAMLFKGRTPPHPELKLLWQVCVDCRDFLDHSEFTLLRELILSQNYSELRVVSEIWGADSLPQDRGLTAEQFAVRYLIGSFLKKVIFPHEADGRQLQTAIVTFRADEQRCADFNQSGFRALAFSEDLWVQRSLERMRYFIRQVLTDDPDLDRILDLSRHGTGATVDMPSRMGHRYYKYATPPYAVSTSAETLAATLILRDARWVRALNEHFPTMGMREMLNSVGHNRIDFVPKNYKTDRPIACEPDMNLMLQLGVDGVIRGRLKRFGVDLDDQTINQRLAQIGSKNASLATVDLSSASDSVSIQLVRLLLPPAWFHLLMKLRSAEGIVATPDGEETLRYEKISSMGNGYTFALESLIFAAAVYAVTGNVRFGETQSVYGDDIIVPTGCYGDLAALLNLCGFVVNSQKTFSTGAFRESCGKDFMNGQDVRPVFLRSLLDEMDSFAAYNLINGLQKWMEEHLCLTFGESSAVRCLIRWLPESHRIYGPYSLHEFSYYVMGPAGRARHDGTYRYDVWTAKAKTYDEPLEYFRLLACELSPHVIQNPYAWDRLMEGAKSQFDVTRRGEYHAVKRRKVAFAWPTCFSEAISP